MTTESTSRTLNVNSLTPGRSSRRWIANVIGQQDAKRMVAIALRNRWRRQQLAPELRDEVMPKNIITIGPTGVGKTEIARRLANLPEAPFIKVEAPKFTEVGYVGRDVESIIPGSHRQAIGLVKTKHLEMWRKASRLGEERLPRFAASRRAVPFDFGRIRPCRVARRSCRVDGIAGRHALESCACTARGATGSAVPSKLRSRNGHCRSG